MNTLAGSAVFANRRRWAGTWYQDNAAASQAAVALTLSPVVGAYSTSKMIMQKSGHITGICVKTNDPRTAGTLTVEVYKSGAGTGLTAVLDGANTTFKKTTQALGSDTFVAGDDLDVRITTSADWAPDGTGDIQAYIEIES